MMVIPPNTGTQFARRVSASTTPRTAQITQKAIRPMPRKGPARGTMDTTTTPTVDRISSSRD